MTRTPAHGRSGYRPTESKYKGGADEMYVTYDLIQRTRGGGGSATYPKIKRVYISGDVKDWSAGRVQKRSGRKVRGVSVDYEQAREGYHRGRSTARRDGPRYSVPRTSVKPTRQEYTQVVEVPDRARNLRFYKSLSKVPVKYRRALQSVR